MVYGYAVCGVGGSEPWFAGPVQWLCAALAALWGLLGWQYGYWQPYALFIGVPGVVGYVGGYSVEHYGAAGYDG